MRLVPHSYLARPLSTLYTRWERARLTDEHSPNGERKSLGIDIGLVLVIEHTVKGRDVSVLITNDWEFEVSTSKVIYVLDPSVVGVDVVCG